MEEELKQITELALEQSEEITAPEKSKKEKKTSGKKKDTPKKKKAKKNKGSKKDKPDPWCMNRELSWLKFNERCLNEAANPRVPLAERLTFVSIFQTNLDEFFMVRVGTLMLQMKTNPDDRDNKSGLTAKQQVSAILKQVSKLRTKYGRVYRQLMGELEPEGVRFVNFEQLSIAEEQELEKYFDARISPYLSPILVEKDQPFPFLDNELLYAAVMLTNVRGKKRVGIVPCANRNFPRLIEIPSRAGSYMLSEELILHFVHKLFPRHLVREKAVLRLTRNADTDDIDLADEELDYRSSMEKLIKQRRRLSPVRVELNRAISDDAIDELCEYLNVRRKYLAILDCPLDMSFVFDLQARLHKNPALFYEKRVPQDSPLVDKERPMAEQVREKDILLFYPYEAMRPFVRMLEEAATDSSVKEIKITLYRMAEQSQIVNALAAAAENGKKVTALVELRARFDEEHNIEASHRLEDAGCRILYGLPEYKVHSKLCLIMREAENGTEYMMQIGTGNYNEKTSRLYTDFSLLTANQKLCADAERVFRALEKSEPVEDSGMLMVAPHCLQNQIIDLIDEQIQKAHSGHEAYVGAKLNALTDKVLIDKLVEASMAGVKIELIVRGICCLIPELPGYTENITVVSIVGRYLEHARIYRFGVGDEEKIFISSADFMTRNTTRRVEVAAPILDTEVKKRIRRVFDLQMLDDEKGKRLGADGLYHDRELGGEKSNSQEILYAASYAAAGAQ